MRKGLSAIAVLAAAQLLPSAAQATSYASPDQPSPALDVPQADLDAALTD